MISAVVLTKNSAKSLGKTLSSLRFCEEILVVDDNSTDDTLDIAKKHNAKVLKQTGVNDFSLQRNMALEKVKNQWILYIDSDEIVTKELAEEILEELKNSQNQSYYLRRRDFFWEKFLTHGEVATAYQKGIIRLVKKGSGHWHDAVHEEFILNSPSATLKHFIDHYPHQTVSEFLTEINHYSSIRASELMKQGKKSSIIAIITVPFFKFLYTYFLKIGFMDGPAGFAYSFFMSFHSFLVRAKIYQHQHIRQA